MIEITALNSSANLLYFEEYLLSNYSFKSFIVGVDSLHLEFETEPNESEQTDIINFFILYINKYIYESIYIYLIIKIYE